MALSARLELRQSQSLVMTPQLMQAIKLLQLSNMDLVTYIEQELERNPLLERADDGEGDAPATEPADADLPARADAPDWFETEGAPSSERVSNVLDTDIGEAVWLSQAGVQSFRLDQPLERPLPYLTSLPEWLTSRDRAGDRIPA